MRPNRFMERNVWHTLEEAIARLQILSGKPVSGLVDTLEAFGSSGEGGAGFIGQALVRDMPSIVPPRSIRLILVSPPALSSAVWSLSYLWGAWLLGAEAAAPLQPLLRQRTPDVAWYARVMARSLRTLASLLGDDGRLIMTLTNPRLAVVEALLLASSGARLGLASLVQCASDYRLELAPTFPQATSVSDGHLETRIQEVAAEAAVNTIQARGEPVAWRTLHAAIHARLAQAGLLSKGLDPDLGGASPLDLVAEQVKRGLETPALVELPGSKGNDTLWWLADPSNVAHPLSDRVEAETYEILQATLALTEADFARAVYSRFPGALTPEADLVATCLRAYGREPTPGYWQLRKEDLPEARQTEKQTVIEHLLALGRRLGYRAEPKEPFDIIWIEGDRVRSVLVVRWQGIVGEVLTLSDEARGAHPYLVIPGGRAALVRHKLSHNPLWQQMVDDAGWQFIKYRHVRQLAVQSEVDEYALQTIVGLDPIVEREGAQIPLF
jgi:hypothetical protein